MMAQIPRKAEAEEKAEEIQQMLGKFLL